MGFRNVSNHYASFDANRDMLLRIDAVLRWVDSRRTFIGASRKSDD